MLLVFRNILVVEITLGMPDLIVAEIIALDVIGHEAYCRHPFHRKNRGVCSTVLCRTLPRFAELYLERVTWTDLLDRSSDLYKVIVHRLRNVDAYRWFRTAVAVEHVRNPAQSLRLIIGLGHSTSFCSITFLLAQ